MRDEGERTLEHRKIIKPIGFKSLLASILGISALFLAMGIILTGNIREHFHRQMTEEARWLAGSYAFSLTTGVEAHEIINNLLEEKILAASRAVINQHEALDDQDLAAYVLELGVDEIYLYNAQGEVLHSSTGKFIGWKAEEGHPVHDFMNGGQSGLVEAIRQDTVSGVYYKYGYFRAPEGDFVQIGVLAEKINDFRKRFEVEELVSTLFQDAPVDHLYFIDNQGNITASGHGEPHWEEGLSPGARAAVSAGQAHNEVAWHSGEKVYQVLLPIRVEGKRLGTLAVLQSMEETERIIRNGNLLAFLVLGGVFLGTTATIAAAQQKNRRLYRLAFYDPLTGLPNKEQLTGFLEGKLQSPGDRKKAVMLVSCSSFKVLNMTFGYQVGDQVLEELAGKLRDALYGEGELFRFSGGRFLLYVEGYESQEDLVRICGEINQVFRSPYRVTDANKYVLAQIGILELTGDHRDTDQVFKDVAIAVDHVKDSQGSNHCFFDMVMEHGLVRARIIESELEKAVKRAGQETVFLHYQPQLDLKAEKVIGFEALARMECPRLGTVPPMEFIDIAEKRHLIAPLGQLILGMACRFQKRLADEGHGELRMAVNVSAIQLLREDFFDSVMETVRETGIRPRDLELEITESMFVDNYEIINEKLEKLRKAGIKVALDDFGTGYSSFARIKELHIDTVKIDKHFIDRLLVGDPEEAIAGDIIRLSHRLGFTTVAEGVEEESQKEYLKACRCDVLQGYLFSRPLEEGKALELLKR
ncbi:putative bifunctional diguanylate cyclase/phosphodiesterase [Anaerotalea alkaliphila]|uniref:Phosphodiesterase n=1 Tax=Anaerotalea alkaliphila TaxID=2662126 RepID=A0A7X5HV79_9FIRM|nr:phosphodiesterase [Anaerotalea alkaliphila]NDL67268.1 phosphodiesterase [Anaerotalea alkaliphila]